MALPMRSVKSVTKQILPAIAPRAELLKKSVWLFHEALPTARDNINRSEVAMLLPSNEFSWCLSSSLSWSVGSSIKDEVMDVVRSSRQWAHSHAGLINHTQIATTKQGSRVS